MVGCAGSALPAEYGHRRPRRARDRHTVWKTVRNPHLNHWQAMVTGGRPGGHREGGIPGTWGVRRWAIQWPLPHRRGPSRPPSRRPRRSWPKPTPSAAEMPGLW